MAQPAPPLQTFPVIDGVSPVVGLSLVLAMLFVAGRLAANIRLHCKLFLDDYAAATGFTFFITYTGLLFGIDHYARYVHFDGTWDATASYFQKNVYAAEVIGPPASLTAKVSVLLLYLRIFNPSVPLRRGVATLFACACIVFTPSLPLFSFYCAPNASDTSWSYGLAQNCLKANIWTAFLQCADVLVNVAILILPMPSIFRLQLSLKRRLLLAFVLMHGIFALAASITGAVYRVNLAQTTNTSTALWFRSAAFVCFEVELGMTLVSGSFHACWGFIRSAATQRASRRSNFRREYDYSEDRSHGSAEKTSTTTQTGLSERAEDGRRFHSGFGSSEDRPDALRNVTTLPRPPAARGPRSMPRASPALQPGLASLHIPHPSPSSHALPPSPREESEASTTPTATITPLEDLQYSPAPSSEACESSEVSAAEDDDDGADTHATTPSRIVPNGRLMAEIEAAVAAAGKARLVVGHTRPSSGVSFEGVDVQRVIPLSSWDHENDRPSTSYASDAMQLNGGLEQYREYIVEKVGEEQYEVEKVPSTFFYPEVATPGPWEGSVPIVDNDGKKSRRDFRLRPR